MIAPLRRLIAWCNDVSNILTLYVVMMLSGAWLFSIFERQHFFESLWWAVVTAMTVGYGDLYPHTLGGRVVGIVLMHVMVFLIAPMLIGLVINRMLEDKNAFTNDEQEGMKKSIRRIEKKVNSL